MTECRVSIIIVNYHSENDIANCLESIETHTTDVTYEVWVVSNSSVNPTDRESLINFKHVHLLQLDDNYGFAYACNRGAEQAQGEYLFFLNPDTCFLNDVLRELINFDNTLSKPALIGPKTFNEKRELSASVKNDITRGFFFLVAVPFLSFLFKKKHDIYHYTLAYSQEVSVLNGHAIMIPKTHFNKLGKFDEQFFMYWEEHDLCIRARENNYGVYFCNDAKVIHLKGTSTQPFFNEMEAHKNRSLIKYLLKHAPHLVQWDKYAHIFGYSWRFVAALLLFDSNRARRYLGLLKWYTFHYGKEKRLIENHS